MKQDCDYKNTENLPASGISTIRYVRVTKISYEWELKMWHKMTFRKTSGHKTELAVLNEE